MGYNIFRHDFRYISRKAVKNPIGTRIATYYNCVGLEILSPLGLRCFVFYEILK
jgi:hypothetical protein